MVADTRGLKGTQTEYLNKISILPNGIAFGLSGPKFILDKLIPLLGARRPAEKTFDAFIDRAESTCAGIYRKYHQRRGDEWEPFGVLVVGLDRLKSGVPRVSHIHQRGFAEEVEFFDVIGHGQDSAYPFVKMLYDPRATVTRMWKGSFYAIALVEGLGLDVTVGGFPEVVTAATDKPPESLDYSEIGIEGAADKIRGEWVEDTKRALEFTVFVPHFPNLLHNLPNYSVEKWAERIYKEENRPIHEALDKLRKATKSPSQ